MMNTALRAAVDKLETASWLVLLRVLQKTASSLQVSRICYDVQAGVFFKGMWKNNLVERLKMASCPKVTHSLAVSVHLAPSVYWHI